ncbi:nucleolar RNA helicase 2-like [Platysternon megacephalum]|uniref:Nucleolar RNA helicase 2-like n=1 Tax=Platysternon megacephalum TaxID=55544 RepID=A0A4D9EY69_9SAUR|nr:nucleolar RNA helicase 2-like [Platysternon megacephalum]
MQAATASGLDVSSTGGPREDGRNAPNNYTAGSDFSSSAVLKYIINLHSKLRGGSKPEEESGFLNVKHCRCVRIP